MRSLPGDSDLVGEAKFLGVTLDPRLQWGLHIDSVPGKATKGIYNGLLCHLPFTYILRHSGLGAFFRGP
ncbi:unnamed protein product [Acanthoscelides obtectus]|uniref:Uncharacterized protein n=1 Tax=Acanthoscelides obtectus TaxID=200917 RepID=A0A9P0KAZ5_ACAOB|nr:unnamed protein product [Acanthoscelides obtectus]CAK1630683.1 hypothetical protein AOBTE_LOCUS6489 [Acanthoscelides obtectus]